MGIYMGIYMGVILGCPSSGVRASDSSNILGFTNFSLAITFLLACFDAQTGSLWRKLSGAVAGDLVAGEGGDGQNGDRFSSGNLELPHGDHGQRVRLSQVDEVARAMTPSG